MVPMDVIRSVCDILAIVESLFRKQTTWSSNCACILLSWHSGEHGSTECLLYLDSLPVRLFLLYWNKA